LKKNKSPGIDQIPMEMIQARGETLRSEIHKLSISVWSEEELPEEWKESVVVLGYMKGYKTDCGNYRRKSLLSTSCKNFIQYSSLKVKSIRRGIYWETSVWILI
jgi:hypothetical protein